MPRDPYPWMSLEEVLDRLQDELDTCEDSCGFDEWHARWLAGVEPGAHVAAGHIDQDGAFGYAYTAAALTKAIYLLSQHAGPGSDGVAFIEAERKRQVEDEGWTPEHDDTHTDGILAGAAALLAIEQTDGDFLWPNYEHSWLKGLHDKHELTPRIRQLAIAGALIAAEIDRLQRVKS